MKNNNHSGFINHMRFEDYVPYAEPSQNSDFEEIFRFVQLGAIRVREYRCTSTWEQPKETRFYDYVYFFLEGSCRFSVGTEKGEFEGPTALIVPAGQSYFIKGIGEDNIRFIVVAFDARIFNAIPFFEFFKMPALPSIPEYSRVKSNLIEMSREYCLKPLGWRKSFEAGFDAVFIRLLRANLSELAFKTNIDRPDDFFRLKPCFDHIKQNISKNIKIKDLASLIHVEEVRLRQLFNSAIRMSPTKYIQNMRLDHAANLLINATDSIQSVANKSGIRDMTFFYKLFSEKYRCTPKEFRQSEGRVNA